ncbi:MAG: GatB/YqeY domain-containing protein [Bdellovibrionales bacterium]|nr:GatB/YqeY domain-containing protein [Bdellovibrionales bacterium]
MSLKEKILKELSLSMKNREIEKLKVLRLISAGIKNKEIELRPKKSTDADILAVLKKQIKQVKESLDYCKKANRKEDIQKGEFELSVLESFVPKGPSEEELKKMLFEVITESKAQSIKDMGTVMKKLMTKTKGLVDGQQLSQMVRFELSRL